MYLVCWNHSCRQTYSADLYEAMERDVACEKCGGTLISPSGKVTLSNTPDVIRTIDDSDATPSDTEELKPCPFCGGEAVLGISDDEGNQRDEDYESDPWSGLSYIIMHHYEDNEGCPIARYRGDGGVGVYLYDSRKKATDAWNKRGRV